MVKSFMDPHPGKIRLGKLQGSAAATPQFAVLGDRKILSGHLQISFNSRASAPVAPSEGPWPGLCSARRHVPAPFSCAGGTRVRSSRGRCSRRSRAGRGGRGGCGCGRGAGRADGAGGARSGVAARAHAAAGAGDLSRARLRPARRRCQRALGARRPRHREGAAQSGPLRRSRQELQLRGRAGLLGDLVRRERERQLPRLELPHRQARAAHRLRLGGAGGRSPLPRGRAAPARVRAQAELVPGAARRRAAASSARDARQQLAHPTAQRAPLRARCAQRGRPRHHPGRRVGGGAGAGHRDPERARGQGRRRLPAGVPRAGAGLPDRPEGARLRAAGAGGAGDARSAPRGRAPAEARSARARTTDPAGRGWAEAGAAQPLPRHRALVHVHGERQRRDQHLSPQRFGRPLLRAAALLSSGRRDLQGGGGPGHAASPAAEGRGAGGRRRGDRLRPGSDDARAGGADAGLLAGAGPEGARPGAGAVREGGSLPARPAQRAAHLHRDPRRIRAGPRHLLDRRLPARAGDGAGVAPMSTLAPVGTRRRGLAGFAVLALLASGAACRRGDAHVEALPPEDEVWIAQDAFGRGEARTGEARPQLLSEPIAAGGRIACDDQRVTHVFSPVTGKVTRVIAQPGQLVKKGAPLAAIASPDVGSAFADEAKGRADLIAAEHDLKRQTALFAEKAASSRDFENAEDNYRKARAEHQRALQRLRLLREGRIDAVTQEYLLPSQIDGRVVARTVNPGMEGQGQFSGGTAVELFTIGSTEGVWLFADVSEAELPELREGAAVAVRVLAYPDQVFHGKVEWISATLDPALRTARIRCSLPNPGELLKPEMFASVRIERPTVPRLAVSCDAIVRIGDQSFVYVAGGTRPDGRQVFKRRHVQIPNRDGPPRKTTQAGSEVFVPAGSQEPDGVPVLAGLAEGEQVLIDAGRRRPRGADDALLSREQLALGQISTVLAEERDVPDAVTLGGRVPLADP